MKHKLILLLLFLLPTFGFCQHGAEDVRKVAILEVVDKEESIEYGVELMLRSSLSAAVTNTPGYEGYDRVNVAQIMGEQNFQRTGAVSDDQIKKLGEMTGASYILVAEAAKLDAGHLFITAKILDVESARMEKTAGTTSGISVEELERACNKLASDLFDRPFANANVTKPQPQSQKQSQQQEQPQKQPQEQPQSQPQEQPQPQQQPQSRPQTGSYGEGKVYNPDGIEMVYVEGSGAGILATKSFYIGKYEVTQTQWKAVMGNNPSNFAGENNPVEKVSWNDVQKFINKLNAMTGRTYSLPTEAQWEYAALGGKNGEMYKYAGSDDIGDVAWYSGNSGSRTHPVGTKSPNSLGIYDMTGNVWEWCSECYEGNCSRRVLRGGSWLSGSDKCRVAYRSSDLPDSSIDYLGFRLVLAQ